ncbi:MAG: spore coat U domain-containing protein [Proteobacteria bacterium]|nr:MAG: spore coat U domain-containing protein [Pseudomonadota bacterium]
MNLKPRLLTTAILVAGLTFSTAQAATVTDSMPVTITIENACEISTAPTTLDFGTQGVLSANIDSLSTISVTCTTAAPYNIGLNGGASGNINARTMTDGTDFVGYQLYQESGRTTVWGDTVGSNTMASTGTGVEQYFSVYGRVAPQTTPPAGTYNDSVTVTVTY